MKSKRKVIQRYENSKSRQSKRFKKFRRKEKSLIWICKRGKGKYKRENYTMKKCLRNIGLM